MYRKPTKKQIDDQARRLEAMRREVIVFDADTGERVRCGLIGGIIGAAHKMTPRMLAARNFEGM